MLKGEITPAEDVEAVRRTVEAQRRVERQRLRARKGRGPNLTNATIGAPPVVPQALGHAGDTSRSQGRISR